MCRKIKLDLPPLVHTHALDHWVLCSWRQSKSRHRHRHHTSESPCTKKKRVQTSGKNLNLSLSTVSQKIQFTCMWRRSFFDKLLHFTYNKWFFSIGIGRQSAVGGLVFPSEPLTSIPFMVSRKRRQRGSTIAFNNTTLSHNKWRSNPFTESSEPHLLLRYDAGRVIQLTS